MYVATFSDENYWLAYSYAANAFRIIYKHKHNNETKLIENFIGKYTSVKKLRHR